MVGEWVQRVALDGGFTQMLAGLEELCLWTTNRMNQGCFSPSSGMFSSYQYICD